MASPKSKSSSKRSKGASSDDAPDSDEPKSLYPRSRGPQKQAAAPKRRRISQLYVEPHMPPWWDVVVISLTVLTIIGLFIEWYLVLPKEVTRYLQWADNGVCAIFIGEFLLRMKIAPRRLEFVRRNWIDLLGAIPMVDFLRSARLVRFARLLRVMRFFVVWRRIARRYDIPLPKGALTNLGLTTAVIWLVSAFSFYRFEHATNDNINTFGDAVWWSMTTLSTVGYGDLYPGTDEGRVIAMLTMVLGIGLLGTVAATTATTFMELRDRGKKGLRSYVMRDHLLVLGWNDKGERAINNFRDDPRHAATNILIVADVPEKPINDADVRFVRGSAGKVSVLKKASAENAGAAIVLSMRPDDPRSDHESALVVTSLRRVNPTIRIGVEMIEPDNREHLMYAGADAIIDFGTTIANLLVRAIQDEGVSDVVAELINSEVGSEIYRVPVSSRFVGEEWSAYAKAMVEDGACAIGIARGQKNIINPETDMVLEDDDDAFIVSREPPTI